MYVICEFTVVLGKPTEGSAKFRRLKTENFETA